MLDAGGRLIVVGYGNMGKALVAGLIKAGLVKPGAVVAVDPEGPVAVKSEKNAVRCVPTIAEVGRFQSADAVVLAVKPQIFPTIASELATALAPNAGGVESDSSVMVLSVMAGVTARRIADAVGKNSRIVRAMPNMPAQVGMGATAFSLGPGAGEDDAKLANAMLRALGPLVVQIDESLMDAFTAVAGSGPAYFFYLAEAMTAGAVAAGFDRVTADAIVRQTLTGSASLLTAESAATSADLRARVTSKGGTTEAAVKVLSQRQAHDAFVAAILAARDRGRELGRVAPAKPQSNA